MKFEYNKEYFDSHFSSPFYLRYIDMRNRFIKNETKKFVSSGNFLDIGFGDDNLIKFFTNDFEVFGIDISDYAVKKIKEKYNPTHFKVCDISKEKIPFEEKFDIIASINTIEHVENTHFALCNIFNSLKYGGIFVIYLPTMSNFLSRTQYKIFYDGAEHIFRPSITEIKKLLMEVGFKICKEYSATFIPMKISNKFILSSFNLYLSICLKKK